MGTEHFSDNELKCKCGCGRAEMDQRFMRRLEELRVAFGRSMPVTSGFRCPGHNAKVSHTGDAGPHTTGKAVDIQISGDSAYYLLLLAFQMGFTGLGISQRGAHAGRFVHIDDLPVDQYPRPRVWSY